MTTSEDSGRPKAVRPLAGVKVVDFSTLLPGPMASLFLAEAGAEVVKVERPGGEDMRFYPPLKDGASIPHALLNRGKRIVEADLKDARDRECVMALIAEADILIEQFRPGVMDRLGLGYETLSARHPRLIYCAITGYGQDGPKAGAAGHDLNYTGDTGLLALAPGPAEAPTVPPALIADIGGGTMPAVINILLALRAREATGRGAFLDIAMTDAMFTFGWYAHALGLAGQYPAPGEMLLAGGSPRYQLYRTADGRFLACAALEDKFWAAFCAGIGLDPALSDPRADPSIVKRAVAAIIAARDADTWRALFATLDCCATIVASLEEAQRDPHFSRRGLFDRAVMLADGTALAALPVPIDAGFRR